MVRGLFTGWTGMYTEQKRLDVISNNMANAATTAYKADNVTNQSFEHLLTIKTKDASELFNDRSIGSMSLGVKLGEVYTDFSNGSLKQTENTFDLGLSGNGFFNIVVTDANGNESIKYTRDGSFTMTRDGYIVDSQGNRLVSESGELQISVDAGNVVIAADGSVYVDEEYVDKIKITDFENYDYLEKYGDNMYRAVDGYEEIESGASVVQGYLEQSNVNIISEMVDMINITRAYEANQKVIQTMDSSLEQVVALGKV